MLCAQALNLMRGRALRPPWLPGTPARHSGLTFYVPRTCRVPGGEGLHAGSYMSPLVSHDDLGPREPPSPHLCPQGHLTGLPWGADGRRGVSPEPCPSQRGLPSVRRQEGPCERSMTHSCLRFPPRPPAVAIQGP